MEAEGVGGEADARAEVGGGGFDEDGWVVPDEFDGAGGEGEAGLGVGCDGEGDGFGGLGEDEVLEGEEGFEVFLLLHRVIEAAVSHPFDLRPLHEGGPLMMVVVGGDGV